jgi:hypothetical protein
MRVNEQPCAEGEEIMMRAGIVAVMTVTLGVTGGAAHSASGLVYVVTSNQQFGTVDLLTGAFAQIGPNTPEGQANLVWGPDGALFSLTVSGNLEKIDPATGATTVVGQTGLSYNAFSLAAVGGRMYATDFANNVYSIDPGTGAATFIRQTGMPADPAIPFTFNTDGTMNLCDESFYGVAGRLFATFDAFTLNPVTLAITPTVAPVLYEIDPRSGAATAVAPTLLNLGAAVETQGRYYGFRWIPAGFGSMGPEVITEVVSLRLEDGTDGPLAFVDPAAGGITGAAPIRNDN